MSFFFLLMVTMDVDNVTNDGIWSVVQLRLECSKGAESTIPLPYNTTPVHRETLRGRNSCRNLYTSQISFSREAICMTNNCQVCRRCANRTFV